MHPDNAVLVRKWLVNHLVRQGSPLRYFLSTRDEMGALRVLDNAETSCGLLDHILAVLGYVPKNAVQGLRDPKHPDGSRRVRALRRKLEGPRGEKFEQETETV